MPDNKTLLDALDERCRCGHPEHEAQCPATDGCWCDTVTKKKTDNDDVWDTPRLRPGG